MRSYYVNHLLAPLPTGHIVAAHAWPLHLTIVGNFITTLTEAEVLNLTTQVLTGQQAITLHADGEADFGPAGEFHVTTLAPNPDLQTLHTRLADTFQPTSIFDQPAHLRAGYRAHVTHQTDGHLTPGDTLTVASISLFGIDKTANTRTLLRTWQLASAIV